MVRSIFIHDRGKLSRRFAWFWFLCFQTVLWSGQWTSTRKLLASLAYSALVFWFFYSPGVREIWDRGSRFGKYAAAGLLVLLVNVQLLQRSDLTYPLAAWTMYASRQPDRLRFVELVGVRADETRRRLPIEGLVMSTMPFVGLLKDYQAETGRMAAAKPEEAARRRRVLEAMLVELGRAQGRRAGESVLARVELVERTLGPDGAPADSRLLYAVDLAPAGGGSE